MRTEALTILARIDAAGRVLPRNGRRPVVLAYADASGAVHSAKPLDARPPLTDAQFAALLKRYATWGKK